MLTPALFAGLLGVLLLAGWLVRFHDLDADPPPALSWSQGIYTDGAVVVHDARNLALHGQWIIDYCEDLALFPLSNLLAAPTFRIFGVGRSQAAIPNTVLGILAILLFSLGLVRSDGRGRTLLWVSLACFNYFLIMIHRVPFAEPAMVFLMAAGFLCYVIALRQSPFFILAGFLAGAAPLFGKMHAVYFPAVLLLTIMLIREKRPDRIRDLRFASLGILTALILWLAFIYLPHSDYIFAHVTYESVSKHDPGPIGFLREFAQNLIAMGSYTNLFDKMPIIALLGFLGVAGVLRKGRRALREESPVTIFLLTWLLVSWVFLSAVKLPAPRYMIALLFPFLYFAAQTLGALFKGARLRWTASRSWAGSLAGAAALFFVLYQPIIATGTKQVQYLKVSGWGRGIYDAFIRTNAYSELVALCLVETLVLVAIVLLPFFVFKPKEIRLGFTPGRGRLFAIILLSASFFMNMGNWTYWSVTNTHFLRDASLDVAEWTAPGARLMGSFAPALGLDNDLPVFPYFGGLGDQDPFRKYGISHIVISSKGDHNLIRDQYPEIFEKMVKVASYPLLGRYTAQMSVYRLPSNDSEGIIHAYRGSELEQGVDAGIRGEWREALSHLASFLEQAPGHADAYYLMGFMYNQLGDHESGAQAMLRAIELRPERPRYWEMLGSLYAEGGRMREARSYMERAYRLNPRDEEIRAKIERLGGVSH